MTDYHASVWRKAASEAEQDVMRATATPPGGRKDKEPLEDYVMRTRKIQDGAMARYLTACAEFKAIKGTDHD